MKLATTIILGITLLTITFFVSPTNWFIIFIYITLLSSFSSLIASFLLPKKFAVALFLGIFILAILLVLDLFDIINIILTVGLILGILMLV